MAQAIAVRTIAHTVVKANAKDAAPTVQISVLPIVAVALAVVPGAAILPAQAVVKARVIPHVQETAKVPAIPHVQEIAKAPVLANVLVVPAPVQGVVTAALEVVPAVPALVAVAVPAAPAVVMAVPGIVMVVATEPVGQDVMDFAQTPALQGA